MKLINGRMAAVVVAACIVIGGCATQKEEMTFPFLDHDLASAIPKDKINNLPRKYAAKGVAALDRGDLVAASDAFNRALKLDVTNSRLQFLNALAYHLRARAGDEKCFNLADEGYALALRFDPSNWEARYYRGLLAMDRRDFAAAERYLAGAVRDDGRDPEALYQLATAAYYAGDPKTAESALERVEKINGKPTREVARASALTLASMDRIADARTALSEYRAMDSNVRQVAYVERRIDDWQNLYDGDDTTVAQGFGFSLPATPQSGESGNADVKKVDRGANDKNGANGKNSANMDESFAESRMILVDVVIIASEEDDTSSMGVNLLNGLQLQFGDPTIPTPAISWAVNKINDTADSSNDEFQHTFTRLISIPAITYSLNIANALADRNEIIARPTLVALAGQTSEFFSGTEISAAAVSGGGGDSVSVEKKVGVHLTVTPDFLDKNHIRLNVKAQRTFLTNPSSSVVFQFRLDTSVTEVNANVVMRPGETLVISGLTEKENDGTRNGVPFLEDIPGVQYLFSANSRRNYRKSVTILLTPRLPYYPRRAGKQGASNPNPEIAAAEREFSHWLKLNPNRQAILEHFKRDGLERDFRTGDFPLRDWTEEKGHEERLRRALEFLYY